MFTFQKSGAGKYLKQLLVALIVVGLMGMYIIPQHFTYGGQGDKHRVEFFDFNNVLLSEQIVDYGQSAAPPPDSAANLPDGYTFLGWSRDYTYVTDNLLIWPSFEWTNMPEAEPEEMPVMDELPEGFVGMLGSSLTLLDAGPDCSDLINFLDRNGLVIKDVNGADVATYYYDNDYDFEISFSFPKLIDGTLYRPIPDGGDSGYIYYRLPDGIVVKMADDYQGALEGIAGGKYWILTDTTDENDPFTYVKVEIPAKILSDNDCSFKVNFLASFDGNVDNKEFDFGNNLTVTVKNPPEQPKVDNSRISMKKDSSGLDYSTKTIDYKVTLTVDEGTPQFDHFYDDLLESNQFGYLRFDENPVTTWKITHNGTDISSECTFGFYDDWYGYRKGIEWWLTERTGEPYPLKKGDVLELTYTMSFEGLFAALDDSYGYNLNLINTNRAYYGKEPEKGFAQVTDKARRDFSKTAGYARIGDSDAITWYIYLGDGMTDLRGMTLTEVMPPEVIASLDLTDLYEVVVNYYGPCDLINGIKPEEQVSHFRSATFPYSKLFPGDTHTIGAGETIGSYVSGAGPDTPICYATIWFTTKITGDVPTIYNNTIVLNDGERDWETTGIYVRPTPQNYMNLEKTGLFSEDGRFLDWTITYVVPGSSAGYPLYFDDYMFVNPGERVYPVYNPNADYNFNVTAAPYTGGQPGAAEILVQGTGYEVDFKNENRQWELHILNDEGERLSPYTQDTLVTITFSIPFDIPVFGNSYGYRTFEEAARLSGVDIENQVDAWSAYKHTTNAQIKYPIKKIQYNDDPYYVRYLIDINVDGKSHLPATPLLIEDTFDSSLMVYDGGLVVQKYDIGAVSPKETYFCNENATPQIINNGNGTSTIKIDFAASYWAPGIAYDPDCRYIVLYNLKLKENVAPGEREVRNTAKFGSYSSTIRTNVGKPAATKNMVASDGGASVDVEIIINEDARSYLGDPYLAKDEMSDRLFLIEETIKFWEMTGPDNWAEISITGSFDKSDPYTYQVIDPQRINFWIPDGKTVKVTYKAFVFGENGQTYEVSNTVDVFGNIYKKNIANFRLVRHSGSGYFSKPEFDLIKTDLLSNERMSGVDFVVYINSRYDGYETNANAPRFTGYDKTKTIGTETYYILEVGNTGSDPLLPGQIHYENKWFTATDGICYAIYELNTPEGYEAPANGGLIKQFSFNMDTSIERGIDFSTKNVGVKNVPMTTEVTLGGTKRVDGVEDTNHSGHTFKLIEVTDQTGNAQKTDVVPLTGLLATSGPGGSFSFDTILNLRAENDGSAKDYYFKVQELVPDNPVQNMIYDDTPRIVKVTVQRGANDVFNVSTTWSGKGNTFINKVLSEAEPVSVELKAIKKAEGASLAGTDFDFILYTMDAAGEKSLSGDYGSYNAETGYITFEPLEFEEPGLYKYLMIEADTELPGWSIDKTGYFFEIDVIKGTGGHLSAIVKYQYKTPYDDDLALWLPNDNEWLDYYETVGNESTWPGFVNEYAARSTSTTIVANKNVTGAALTAGQFRFALLDSDGTVVDLATNAADGTIIFDTPTYTSVADAITYTIVECGPATATTDWEVGSPAGTYMTTTGEGWTYDSSRHTVSVTVTNNAGALSADVTYPDGGAAFTNTYTPDDVAELTGSLELEGLKTINDSEGATWPTEPFTFTITDVTDEDNPRVAATGANGGVTAGTIAFEPIEYILNEDTDETGRYVYVISEDAAGEDWTAKTADITIYVEVVDDGEGSLVATAYSDAGYTVPIEDISAFLAFENEYVFENVRWYDAALRKWVSAVNPVDANNIDTAGIGESNKNADAGTPSPAVRVNVGDRVEYTIRVFNQGPWPLMVTGVVDDLPDGLGFVAGDPADENPVNAGWTLTGGKLRFEWSDPEDIPVLSPQISRFAGVDGYEDFDFGFGPDEQDDNPYYYDLYVTLEVLPAAKAGVPITNSAMITGIKDEDGNDVEDIDSDFDESKLDDPDADDNNVEGDGLGGGDRDEHDIATVYIEGRISVEVDKDTIKRTSAAFNGEDYDVLDGENGEIIDNVGIENFRYDINFRSTSNIDVDEFIVDDPLESVAEGFVRVENLWTPSTWGDMDGRMAVWYKAAKGDASVGIDLAGDPGITKAPTGGELLFPTNRSEGWRLWAVITDSAWTEASPIINRVNLGLPFEPGDDDYITALRFEYGAVQVGFTSKNGDKLDMNNGIRDTNGALGYYGDVIQDPETPGRTGAFTADPQAYTEVSGMSAVTAFATEPLSPVFAIAQTSYTAQQSNAFSDIPGKGETSDWGPEKGRSDFPAEPRNIMSAPLKPATYLVSATVPMMEAEIVSSAIAYIALNGAIEEAEAKADGKTVGAFTTLYDVDQDAVLTRVITPVEVRVQETNIDPLESSSSFLERARLMGLEIREDGLWYDANGRRVQTGDVFAISFWLILLACAGICVVLLIRTVVAPPGRKAKKKDPIPESGKGGDR